MSFPSASEDPEAFTLHQAFEARPPGVFRMDRHYLIYALQGAMRLEAEGRRWSLPPARAALLRAGDAVKVSLPRPMTVCSVLFRPDFVPAPDAPLAVFDMTPLARTLVLETRSLAVGTAPLDAYARAIYRALAEVVWRLAERPSGAFQPVARTPAVARAVELTAARMAGAVRFEAIAGDVGLAPRTLARRMAAELGMNWTDLLRRLRILRAMEDLAEPGASIAGTAFAVGYNSLSAFNTAFRDIVGQTPGEYRAGMTME